MCACIYICVCVCVCVYIYIYKQTKGQTNRKKNKEYGLNIVRSFDSFCIQKSRVYEKYLDS